MKQPKNTLEILPEQTLSNNKIVEEIHRTYKIRQLIHTMVDYSIKDQSDMDLYQYIMEQLLLTNNERLNILYKSKKLRNFISQIIKNQRNSGAAENNTEYQKYRIKDYNQEYIETIDENTYNYKLDIILNYIDEKAEMVECVVYTEPELKIILAYTVLKKYYLSDLTGQQLADHLYLSRSTINMLLRFAKDDIKNYWNNVGKYIEESLT